MSGTFETAVGTCVAARTAETHSVAVDDLLSFDDQNDIEFGKNDSTLAPPAPSQDGGWGGGGGKILPPPGPGQKLGEMVPVYFGTNRKRTGPSEHPKYGSGFGEVEMGICRVYVPSRRERGEVLLKNVALESTIHLDDERFLYLLHKDVTDDANSENELLLFIHGYNVNFKDAARRTAQLKYDLQFTGPAVFFSWPAQASEGRLLSKFGIESQYFADLESANGSRSDCKQFLIDVVKKSGANKVHIIAHSMGTNLLSESLAQIAREGSSSLPMFDQIILAAPDIDSRVFAKEILPHFTETAKRITVYASETDNALNASKHALRDGRQRLGQDVAAVHKLRGKIEGVNASGADTSWLAHSYYGDVPSVLADIAVVLQGQSREDRVIQKRTLQRESDDEYKVPNSRKP